MDHVEMIGFGMQWSLITDCDLAQDLTDLVLYLVLNGSPEHGRRQRHLARHNYLSLFHDHITGDRHAHGRKCEHQISVFIPGFGNIRNLNWRLIANDL